MWRNLKKRIAAFMTIVMMMSQVTNVMAAPSFEWDEETLRGKPEWVEQYPNGLINFATVGYVSEENAKPYEVAVIRQGGTDGEVTVEFKAVGISAEYGKDYVLIDEDGNELVMEEFIPPLMDSLLPNTTPATLRLDGIERIYDILDEQYTSTTSPAIGHRPSTEEMPEVNITKLEGLEKQGQGDEPLNLKKVQKSLHGINGIDLDELETDLISNRKVDEMVRASLPGVSGKLTFRSGERIKYFTVKILEDNESEDEEIFALILQQPTNGGQLGTINSINVYIQDNEPKEYSSISIEKDSYIVEQDAEYVDITVQRKGAEYLFASVQVGTGAITAQPGQDYESMMGEVLFYPGETEKTIRIPVYPNWDAEAKQFGVKLVNPSNAKLGEESSTLITFLGTSEKLMLSNEQKENRSLSSRQATETTLLPLNGFYKVKQDAGASANIGNINFVSAKYSHYRQGESIIQTEFNPVGYYAMDVNHSPGGNFVAWSRGRSYLQLLIGSESQMHDHDGHHGWQVQRFNLLDRYTQTNAANAILRVRASANINGADTFFRSRMTGHMDINNITLYKVAYTANVNMSASDYKYIDVYGNEVSFKDNQLPTVTLSPSEQNSNKVARQYVDGDITIHVEDNEYFKYKGYKIVRGNNTSKVYEGKKLRMSQAFLHENKDRIEYNVTKGTGKFTIVPVFERRALPYEIQDNSTYKLELFKGDTSNVYTTNKSGNMYVGDSIKVKVTPTDSKKGTTTIDVSTYPNKNAVDPGLIGRDQRYVKDVSAGETLLELKGNKYVDRYMKLKATVGNVMVPVNIILEGNLPEGAQYTVFIPEDVETIAEGIRSGSTVKLVAVEPDGYRAQWTINGEKFTGSLIDYVVKGTGNDIRLQFKPITTPLITYEIKGRVEAKSLTLKSKDDGMIGVEGANVLLGEKVVRIEKDKAGKDVIVTTPLGSVLTNKDGSYCLQIKGYPGERHFITVSENGNEYKQLIELGKEDTFNFETDLRVGRAYPIDILARENNLLYEQGNIIYLNDKNITFDLSVRSDENTIKGVNFILHTSDGIEKVKEFVTKQTDGYYQIFRNPTLAFKPGDKLYVQIVENDKEFTNGKPGQLIDTGYVFIKALDSTEFELDLPAIETPGNVSIPLLGSLGPVLSAAGFEYEQEIDEDGNAVLKAGYTLESLPEKEEGGEEGVSDKLKGLGEKIQEVKQATSKKPKDSNTGLKLSKDMQLNKDTKQTAGSNDQDEQTPGEESPYSITPVFGLSMVIGQFQDETGITRLAMRQMSIFIGINGSAEFNFSTITPIGVPVYLGIGMEAKIMLMGIMTPKSDIQNLALNKISHDTTVWKAELPIAMALKLSVGVGWTNLLGVGVWGKGELDILWVPWDNGKGTLTLSAGVDVFVLTLKKTWTLAEEKFDLFNTLPSKSSRPMTFVELQETIYLDELEPISRDYLQKQTPFGNGSGNAGITPFSTLGNQVTTKILSNSPYPLPQTQMMSIGNGKYLLVFITDDANREADDRGALVYSVYDGTNWSSIETIQDDGTLDSSPSLSDLGDKILISWTSVNRKVSELKTTASAALDTLGEPKTTPATTLDILSATDVYCQIFDKQTARLEGNIFNITSEFGNDLKTELYTQDAMPTAAKSKNGDIILFYAKTDYTKEANNGTLIDEVSEMYTAYSDIAYRLYDASKKIWIEDYFDNETQYDQPISDGSNITWAQVLKGQRLVDIRIPSEDLVPGRKPKIVAMQAITIDEMPKGSSYQSDEMPSAEQFEDKAVIAYNVDLDGNPETTTDQEIYIQIYYFSTHEMSHPVRVTNNEVADHTPQLIYHDGESYLFWNQDQRIVYHDIQSLTLNGLEKIKANNNEYLYKVKEGYQEPYQVLDANYQGIGSNFKVVAGEDNNLYVVWTEHAGRAIDFFAVALDKAHQDSETENHGWSKPVRITYFGDNAKTGSELVNEMFDVAVGADGKMYIVNFQKEYDIENYVPTQSKPLPNIIQTSLIQTVLSPQPSINIETTFEKEHPLEGEEQTVKVQIKNTGLLASTSKGNKNAVKATAYLKTDSGEQEIASYTLDHLGTAEVKDWEFKYTLQEGTLEQNPKIKISYQEEDFAPKEVVYDIPFEAKIRVNSISTVSPEKHMVQGTAYVENIGNKPMEKGIFVIEVIDEAGNLYDKSLIEIDLESMDVGEVKEINFGASVEPEWLTSYNTLNTKAYVLSDGNTKPFSDTVRQKSMKHFEEVPVTNIFITPDRESSTINLIIGQGKEVVPIIYPSAAANANNVTMESDNTRILKVVGNRLVPISTGVTTLRVKALPDGFEKVYKVRVKAKDKPVDRPEESNPDSGSGESTGSNSGSSNSKPVAPQDNKQKETQQERMKERIKEYFKVDIKEVKVPFKIAPTHWAYDIILRAVANGVLDEAEDFDINKPINRGNLAKLLGRMFKLEERKENLEVDYKDINIEEEYAGYLLELKELGILLGTGEDTFSPDGLSTREQVISIMVRFYEQLTGTAIELTEEELTPFKDEDISPWARESVAKAAKMGITNGMGDGFFRPQQETSYAHVLTFTERVLLLIDSYEEKITEKEEPVVE